MKKKIFSCAIAVVMLFSLAIPALASSNSQIVVNAETRIWQDGFGFHCNALKGNGATSVINLINDKVVAKGSQKDVFGVKSNPIGLARVANTITWDLLTNDIECATCGRIDWVTFSNNNGVINGKNIEVNHSSTPRYLAEVSIFWTSEILECDIVCDALACTFACELECDCCEPCKCGCDAHVCVECDCAATDAGFVETVKVAVPSAFSYDYGIDGFSLKNITDANGNAVEFPIELPAKKASYSFTFNFEKNGDCECDFNCNGKCDCECDPPGDFFGGCNHEWICSVCWDAAEKGLKKGSHPGCHNDSTGNSKQNTFFCLKCFESQNHWNRGNNPAPDKHCDCPVCNEPTVVIFSNSISVDNDSNVVDENDIVNDNNISSNIIAGSINSVSSIVITDNNDNGNDIIESSDNSSSNDCDDCDDYTEAAA